jgi:structural maintenance of chromosome 1
VRNFLVFQGDIESIASKTPMELTKLIEQISSSESFKHDYDHYLQLRNEAEEKTIQLLSKRKLYQNQRNEVKEQRNEANLFLQKKQLLSSNKTSMVLLQLYTIKLNMEEFLSNIEKLEYDLSNKQELEQNFDNEIANLKKVLAKLNKNQAQFDKDLDSKRKKLLSLSPQLNDIAANIESLMKRSANLASGAEAIQSDCQEQEKVSD